MTKGQDEATTYTLVEFFSEVQTAPSGALFYEEPSLDVNGALLVFDTFADAAEMAGFMVFADHPDMSLADKVEARKPHALIVGILEHDFDARLGVSADDDFDGESHSAGWVDADGVHKGDYENDPVWSEIFGRPVEQETPPTGGASASAAGGFSLRVGTHLVGTAANPEFHEEPCLEIVDDRGKRVDSWSMENGEHALRVLTRLNALPRQTRCALCGQTVTSGDPERYPYCRDCHYTGRAATFIRRAQIARLQRLIPGSTVAVEHTGGGCMWMAVRFGEDPTFYAMTDGEASLPTIDADGGEQVDRPEGGWGYVGRYNVEETASGMPVSEDYEGTALFYDDDALDGLGISDEAAARIVNLDRAVRRGKREILEDALVGRYDEEPKCFSDLHEWVDANEYGGLCDDEQPYPYNRDDDLDAWLSFGNDVQTALDNWIRDGGIRKAIDKAVN